VTRLLLESTQEIKEVGDPADRTKSDSPKRHGGRGEIAFFFVFFAPLR